MRFLPAFLGLWLMLAVSAAHGADATDAVLAEASSALRQGRYEEALSLADNGLSGTKPGLEIAARLLVTRGLAHQALAANEEALVDFTRVLNGNTLPADERARALFARGVSLDTLGRLEDAAGDYGAALRYAPGASNILNNRANVLRRQGKLEEARTGYLAALEAANPNPQYPYFGLGQIAEAQGDPAAARSYYGKALAAAPDFALALERLRAMGPPVDDAVRLPAGTGVIVLKPPIPKEEPAVSEPPQEDLAAVPARPSVSAKAVPAQPRSSLRPAIVEGAAHRGARVMVQLGAWRSEAEAREGWERARRSAGGLLDDLDPIIVRAEIPGRGVYYRLRAMTVGPVSRFCANLAAKNVICVPVRDDLAARIQDDQPRPHRGATAAVEMALRAPLWAGRRNPARWGLSDGGLEP